jgi:hypothetical protein
LEATTFEAIGALDDATHGLHKKTTTPVAATLEATQPPCAQRGCWLSQWIERRKALKGEFLQRCSSTWDIQSWQQQFHISWDNSSHGTAWGKAESNSKVFWKVSHSH